MRQVSGSRTSILKKTCESRHGQNHSKRCEKLQFSMSLGSDKKHFSRQARHIVEKGDAVTLGIAVSESGFRGVEPRICDAECLPRSLKLAFARSLVENARFGSLDFHF